MPEYFSGTGVTTSERQSAPDSAIFALDLMPLFHAWNLSRVAEHSQIHGAAIFSGLQDSAGTSPNCSPQRGLEAYKADKTADQTR